MSRILIVDDDPQLGRSLERVLVYEGHDCRLALDPTIAAEVAATFKPEALLIELQPGYVPALPRLRDALGAIPFVYMAGHHEEYAWLGELVGPFDDWLAKPAVPQEFVVRLRTAMRRARAD
jgi:two-component system OmpR family response regulator